MGVNSARVRAGTQPPMQHPRQERRQHERFTPSRVFASVGGQQTRLLGEVVDVSLGGARIRSQPPRTSKCRVELFTDSDATLIDAAVLVRGPNAWAARFARLTPGAERFIAKLMVTEVLRVHEPTVLVLDKERARAKETAAALHNALGVRTILAHSLLEFVERVGATRPPVTVVVAATMDGIANLGNLREFVHAENPKIPVVGRHDDCETLAALVKQRLPRRKTTRQVRYAVK